MSVVRATSDDSTVDLVALRGMFDAAWGGGEFSDQDWEHATGGTRFLVVVGGVVVSHASVVPRMLETGGRALRTGYVEAVATSPEHRRNGHATRVMRAAGSFVDDQFELGALGTGLTSFYERLGWELWRGPTSVRTEQGTIGTPDEDGLVMVRRTSATGHLDLDLPISCDWRPGDVW